MNNPSHKRRVLIRRGMRHNLPKTAPLGELLYCKDSNDLYIGTNDSVKQLTKGDGIYDGGYFTDEPTGVPAVADGGEF